MPATWARAIGKWSGLVRTSSTKEPISVHQWEASFRVRNMCCQYSKLKQVFLGTVPVRYEVNCFGPQRMGKRVVVLTLFCDTCDPSLGKKCVPSDDSPHQRSLTNVAEGGLWTVHNTRLIVTRRKHLSWPSTRGGRLVEGDTSLGTARVIFDYCKIKTKTMHAE